MSGPHLITRAGAVIAAMDWLLANPQKHLAATQGAQARGREFYVGNKSYALTCPPHDPHAVSFTTLGRIVREAGLPLYHTIGLTAGDHVKNGWVEEVIDEYLKPLGMSCAIIDNQMSPPAHGPDWCLTRFRQHAIETVTREYEPV